MAEQESFVQLMDRLRGRDDDAARVVFQRFAVRLIALARSRLDERVRPKVDAEDVLQSVYRSFFARQRDGEIDIDNWDSLWCILTLITIRKCLNQNQHYRAECRDVGREVKMQGDEICPGTPGIARRDPSPLEVTVAIETLERLLAGLDTLDREVTILQLQNYSIPEISAKVERAERTVHRTLDRVRKRLGRLLET